MNFYSFKSVLLPVVLSFFSHEKKNKKTKKNEIVIISGCIVVVQN